MPWKKEKAKRKEIATHVAATTPCGGWSNILFFSMMAGVAKKLKRLLPFSVAVVEAVITFFLGASYCPLNAIMVKAKILFSESKFSFSFSRSKLFSLNCNNVKMHLYGFLGKLAFVKFSQNYIRIPTNVCLHPLCKRSQ